MGWKRWQFLVRTIIFLLVFVVLSSVGSNSISVPAVKTSGWSGWDSIDTIAILPQSDEFLDTATQELETCLEEMSGRSWTVVRGDTGSPAGAIAFDEAELESLGVPLPQHGIPSTNMWPEGNLLYGEATLAHTDGSSEGPFTVYDVSKRQLVYSGNADIHTGFRNIMVDKEGNAYFSVNTRGLAKYSPSTNQVTVLPITPLPGYLRASTRQAANGWIYAATNSPYTLFRFHPQTNAVETLGAAWGYTAHMVLDPTEKYVYYIPDAHGVAWSKGTPLLQYDVQKRTHKVIAFLNNVYESKYGYRLGGSYALDLDAEGKRLFINMNADDGSDGRLDGFGSPAMFVVHIPESETTYKAIPKLSFEDVASKVGIDGYPAAPLYNGYLHTSSWGDVNNDGWIDLLAGTFFQSPALVTNKLLLNKNGVFEDAGQPAIEIEGRASGSVFADFDNDEDLDLYISNNTQDAASPQNEPSHILRNDNGIFTDVTAGSGIEVQSIGGRQVAVLDYNGDNLLDLFIVADALRGIGPTVLLKNKGNLKFENVTAAVGIPSDVQGLGLAVGDVNNDGWPDIFVAGGARTGTLLQDNRNYLFIANRDGTYRQFTGNVFDWRPFNGGYEDWVSGAAFCDLNRDGRLDLVIAHHFGSSAELGVGAPLRVYLNRGNDANGNPVFEDITSKTGMPNIVSKSPHVEIQDFDNDGWPDIYTSVRIDTSDGNTAPLIFLHNGLTAGDPAFTSPNIINPHYFAGGPVADFNRDGKLDIFLNEFRSVKGTPTPSVLFRNIGAPGNWLQVKYSDGTNTMGVGAKVKIYKAGTSTLLGFREISPAFGWSSSQPAIAHFGLGDEEFIDVVVEMPFGGPVYTETNVPANRMIVMPNPEIERPAHLGLQKIAVRDTSNSFIQDRDGLPSHTVASTAPTVDFVPYPLAHLNGNPWSQWGAGLVASDGKFYTAIGDHLGKDGNSYVYEYDPITKKLKCIGDAADATRHVSGSWGHGKIHSQINEGKDGYIYMTTYWGTRSGLVFDGNYQGSVILRYPLNTVAAGSNAFLGWDVNGDGAVNIFDMVLIGQHWGETGLAGWIREDVNKDGTINILDMIIVGQHWTG